ncbi:MAG: PF20097 family protein [Eubacteriales bacterium]|nr:PF20097 family protein [Eubacteriales bacterium]
MNCPNCERDMQQGVLQAGNLMAFNKTRHKVSLLSREEADVMIVQKAFTSTDFGGWICRKCGLIVFDYTKQFTRW